MASYVYSFGIRGNSIMCFCAHIDKKNDLYQICVILQNFSQEEILTDLVLKLLFYVLRVSKQVKQLLAFKIPIHGKKRSVKTKGKYQQTLNYHHIFIHIIPKLWLSYFPDQELREQIFLSVSPLIEWSSKLSLLF